MHRVNRILLFVSVGFVLLFLGKVSKAGLFSTYVKTLSEVEIRNSHDLQKDALVPVQDFFLDEGEAPYHHFGPDGLAIAWAQSVWNGDLPVQDHGFPANHSRRHASSVFSASAPIRGPGA